MTELRPAPERLRAGLAPRSGMPEAAAVTAAVLRNLGRFATLTAEEAARVAALGATRRRWRPGALLAADGGASGAHFVVSGWACSQRVLRDGRRQIFDFILPGEGFGFGRPSESHAAPAILALTALETVSAGGLADAGTPSTALSGAEATDFMDDEGAIGIVAVSRSGSTCICACPAAVSATEATAAWSCISRPLRRPARLASVEAIGVRSSRAWGSVLGSSVPSAVLGET